MTKPPYHVPTMQEIRNIPWNGYRAASTFSGAGGSTTGYRMAGFRVIYANEFIPAARKTYKANHPTALLDPRDIRTVHAEPLLKRLGLKAGDLDLLDGSPPCASFSMAGKREKAWGTVKKYSDTEQRTDDLFWEFARLVEGVQPKTFVAENVSGLVKGTAKGYFLRILKRLRDAGYKVEARLLDGQWLGVPQARQRIIFVGVRKDLRPDPVFPQPLPYRYTLRDALEGVPPSGDCKIPKPDSLTWYLWHRTEPGRSLSHAAGEFLSRANTWHSYSRLAWDRPAYTVLQGTPHCLHPDECRSLTISELKRVCAFPDDYVLTGKFMHQWERLGRSVPPTMMYHVAKAVKEGVLDQL